MAICVCAPASEYVCVCVCKLTIVKAYSPLPNNRIHHMIIYFWKKSPPPLAQVHNYCLADEKKKDLFLC